MTKLGGENAMACNHICLDNGIFKHPGDDEAWKHINRIYPDFARRAKEP